MDPFALQHEARRRLPGLVALVALAALATSVAMGAILWAIAWCVWAFFTRGDLPPSASGFAAFAARFPFVVATCFAVSTAVVLGGLLHRFRSLSSGDDLMTRLGATRLVRAQLTGADDTTLARLRLFDVCEEMAIAAGLDMPTVWTMDGVLGINALAAGTDPSSAAVCVTEGALRFLTRNELQGVVAHEFSHILNGDMRLNFRLAALVGGISLVSHTGKGLLSLIFKSRDDADETVPLPFLSLRRKRRGLPLPLPLLVVAVLAGLAFCLVGAVGAFCARLLQAAVSREREYLADAAAAQFTRNPEGLANALRLAHLADAAGIPARGTACQTDVAHMTFVTTDVGLLATHPPVTTRIRHLSTRGPEPDAALAGRVKTFQDLRRKKAREAEETFRRNAARLEEARQKADAASRRRILAAELPPELLAATRNVPTAGALLRELLGETGTFGVAALSPQVRRTLALRCVTTLRDGLDDAGRRQWAQTAWDIAVRDGEITSLEIVICSSVRRHLQPAPPRQAVPGTARASEAAHVLSTVASLGRDPAAGYRTGVRRLSLFGDNFPPMPEPITVVETFLPTLEKLADLVPLAKEELLFALRDAAAEDGELTDEELDHLAAVADAIGAFGWISVR